MWQVREVAADAVTRLAQAAEVSELMARLLLLRGVNDAAGARIWLHPSIEHLHDPSLLPDYAAATARLRRAIEARERVLVWGHDDLDGITAAALLCRLLSDLRCATSCHIPAKGRERHGLSAEAMAQRDDGVKLVVTVDCGITNGRDVDQVRQQGMDVIVTDHHEVLDDQPAATANVDPKRPDSNYPYRGLAGVGVAFKLGLGLARDIMGLSVPELLSARPELMTLAVLGTIADRVPLTGENRTIVAVGMKYLETTRLPAVRAVMAAVNAERDRLTVARFVSELLPLFASANGNEGVERLLRADADTARYWVEELTVRSQEWRREAEASYALAGQVVRTGDGILFVRSRDLSLRALGFCAGRLKDRYQVPAIVMGWRGDAWVGECRGIDGVNLIDLLRAHHGFFLDYGGHRRAAGFSIPDERVEEFERSAERYAHEHFAGRIVPENVFRADAELPLAQFDAEVCRLGPFGEGNPEPLFVSEPVRLVRNERGWTPDTRPELHMVARHGAQPMPGVPCRLLYSVDDLGRLTIEQSRPVTDIA